MRKLITLLALILFISCDKIPEKRLFYKYKKGDIVYLRLDGTKIMIESPLLFIEEEPTYRVYYKNNDGSYSSDIIQEFCLTNKPQ